MKNETTGLAKALTKRAKELGIEVKHSHALELLASLKGDRNWHVMASDLKEEPTTYNAHVSAAYGDFKDFPFTISISDKGITFVFDREAYSEKADMGSFEVSRGFFGMSDFFEAGIGGFWLEDKTVLSREYLYGGGYLEGLEVLFSEHLTAENVSFKESRDEDIIESKDGLVGGIKYNDKGWHFYLDGSFMGYVKKLFFIDGEVKDEVIYRFIVEKGLSNGFFNWVDD